MRVPPRAASSSSFNKKHRFFRDSGVLLKSKKVCRQWDGEEETERERERERERGNKNNKEEKVFRIGKARMARNGGGGC